MTSINSKALIHTFKNLCPGTKNYKIYGCKSARQIYTTPIMEIYNDLEKKRKIRGIEQCYRIYRKMQIVYLLKNLYNNTQFNKNI